MTREGAKTELDRLLAELNAAGLEYDAASVQMSGAILGHRRAMKNLTELVRYIGLSLSDLLEFAKEEKGES